jgi:hypothetical protein
MFKRHNEANVEHAAHEAAIRQARQRVAQLPDADGVISIEAFHEFLQSLMDQGLDGASMPDVIAELRLGLAQGGCFIMSETTLLLKKDEHCLLEVPAALLNEVTDKEFRGGSQGVSIPIGGGVRYRVGAVRGHVVTIGTHWSTADTGALTVTEQRVVYHGSRKTLEFPFAKLATLKAYTDALELGVTSRQTTSTFRVGDPTLVAGTIHAAHDHAGTDLTILRLNTLPV